MTTLAFGEQETFLKFFSDGPKRDKGQLFLCLDLPDNPGAEDSIAEKMWRALQSGFYNCGSDDPAFCFEEALKKVNEIIDQEGRKREQGSIGKLHALAALIQDKTLHFSQSGDATILLKRGNHLTPISEPLPPEESFGFHSVSSGDLHSHDMLLCSTRRPAASTEILFESIVASGTKAAISLKTTLKEAKMVGLVMLLSVTPVPEEQPKIVPAATLPLSETVPVRKRWETAFSFVKQKIKPETIEKAKQKFSSVSSSIGTLKNRAVALIKKPPQFNYSNARFILIGILLLLVVMLFYFGILSKVQEKAMESKRYEDLISQIRNNISIAENRFLIGEKSDAVTFLNKAAFTLQEVEASQFFQSNVEKLKKEIALYRDNFDAIIRVDNPVVSVNLSQKQAIDAFGIIHTKDEKNYVYEPRRLFESLLDKVQEGITIDPDEIVIAGAELEDFNVLVFTTQNGQIIEYLTRNGRFERTKTQDQTWKKAVDLKTFNGEYIYLLDSTSKAIWKYRRLRSNYGAATAYTQEGDLTQAVSFAIDGDIYVLLRDSTMLKYRKGKLLPFQVKDQPSLPLKNPSRIFTLPEANHLYVLDSGNKRVVVYSKGQQNGVSNYVKQIVFDSLKPDEIRDFYVDKEEQKIFVMTADKLYIADL